MKQVIVMVLVFTAYSLASARRCYICGNGSEEPFRTGRGREVREARIKSSVSCTEFERSSSMDQFIMECPDDFVGCITQIDGNEIVRTCDSLPLNDCQTANGVKYCYCNTDLCNGKLVTPPTRNVNENHRKNHRSHDEDEDITDDEDFMEASGLGSDPSSSEGGDRNTLDRSNYDDSPWSTPNIPLTTRHPSPKASKTTQILVNLPILTLTLLLLLMAQ
ncbi:uncharacterized protein LOC132263936 [Phlebotomus argentipes]|uniref:uncharacterized protein LOC132263936 n=1 Tax=Phlebotomus argentipes TaxID=94469 RepID=UPI002893532F|nr:uncharacterized protein LOC132263936 [Phlebotomus argentipes]